MKIHFMGYWEPMRRIAVPYLSLFDCLEVRLRNCMANSHLADAKINKLGMGN